MGIDSLSLSKQVRVSIREQCKEKELMSHMILTSLSSAPLATASAIARASTILRTSAIESLVVSSMTSTTPDT